MDSFGFALLVIEAYNGSLPPSISAVPPQGQVPAPIYALVRRMMVPNAKNRLPVANLLEAGQADGGFFTENRLVKVASGLDGFMLSREDERAEIMRQLKSSSDSFPPEFLHYKVLPTLVNALSLSSSPQNVGSPTLQASKILPLVLQLGSKLPDKEWSRSLSAPLLKAWTSADRGVRMTLLESLELYMDRLEAKRISDSVWPNLITGFGDSAPVIREATVKAILPLSEKLSERILNNDLLRQLARSQVDNEAGIRTNTTILLGRLAPKLNLQTRKTVLIPAFARSMKDPFVHARVAGIMSLMATGESYDGDDAAKQIIPAIAPCLVDKEKLVRDQAFMAMKMFMERVKDKVKTMPDTALPPEQQQQQQQASSGSAMAATASANGSSATPGSWAASALAGWTQSAFAKHIDTASLAATTMDGKQTPSAVSTPPVPAASPAPSSSTSAASEAPSWSKQGDLMDVNDDEADWSGFETAPPKKAASLGGARRKMGAKAGGGGSSSSSGSRTSRAQPSLSTRPIASSSSSSSLSMRPSGDALSAMTRKSLAVADAGAADDAAWDEPPEEEERPLPSASTGQPAVQRTESPASAFKKPVEAWDEEGEAGAMPARAEEDEPGTAARTGTGAGTGASVNEAAAWGAIDDAFEDDQDGKGKSSSTTASAAMTREERRAEMERKREERRQRMAQLKQSKAQKLASGLA